MFKAITRAFVFRAELEDQGRTTQHVRICVDQGSENTDCKIWNSRLDKQFSMECGSLTACRNSWLTGRSSSWESAGGKIEARSQNPPAPQLPPLLFPFWHCLLFCYLAEASGFVQWKNLSPIPSSLHLWSYSALALSCQRQTQLPPSFPENVLEGLRQS